MASIEGLMDGLYLLWWVQEKQMPAVIVATVLAASDLALMGLELPTGWFADRFGHRASLMVGSFVQVLGMVWCWLGEGVSGLLTASLLVALGDGFRSGADEALLYRTCLALDREADFQKIVARADAVALAALVALVLLGGVIVETAGYAWGWLAEAALCSLGLLLACAMAEPPARPSPEVERFTLNDPWYIHSKRLGMFIVPAALLAGAASAASFLAQTAGANTPARVTFLVATLTAAEAAGSVVASRLPGGKPRDHFLMAALGTALLLGGVAVPDLLTVAAVGVGFLLGAARPLRAAAIQRLTPDGMRARAASAASACDMAVKTIVLPLAGIWRSRRRR